MCRLGCVWGSYHLKRQRWELVARTLCPVGSCRVNIMGKGMGMGKGGSETGLLNPEHLGMIRPVHAFALMFSFSGRILLFTNPTTLPRHGRAIPPFPLGRMSRVNACTPSLLLFLFLFSCGDFRCRFCSLLCFCFWPCKIFFIFFLRFCRGSFDEDG